MYIKNTEIGQKWTCHNSGGGGGGGGDGSGGSGCDDDDDDDDDYNDDHDLYIKTQTLAEYNHNILIHTPLLES